MTEAKEGQEEVSSRRAFSQDELAEIVVKWESGEYTLDELAEEYDRIPSTLSRKLNQLGIKKGSNALAKVDEVRSEAEHESMTRKEEMLVNLRDIEHQHGTMAKYLAFQQAELIKKTLAQGKTMASIKQDLAAFKIAIENNKMVLDQRIDTVGAARETLVDESTITTLSIGVLSPTEVDDIQIKASIQNGHKPPERLKERAIEIGAMESDEETEAAEAALRVGTPSRFIEHNG